MGAMAFPLPALLLGLSLLGSPGSNASPAAPAAAPVAGIQASSRSPLPPLPPRAGGADFAERVQLDQRLTFTRRGAEAAWEVVAAGGEEEGDLAAALFAVGSGNLLSRREHLAEAARSGSLNLRRAAILALGEMRPTDEALLLQLVRDEPQVAPVALFALARAGAPRGRAFLDRLAAGEGGAAEQARAMLAFLEAPQSARPLPVADFWLQLRWQAARRHGLVDGRSWRALAIEHLARDSAFLDDAVLPLFIGLRHPGARDHIGSLVMEAPSRGALQVALASLPDELSLIAARTEFGAGDSRIFSDLLELLELRGVNASHEFLLKRMLVEPEVAQRAAVLLCELGSRDGWVLLEPELRSRDTGLRARAARGLGGSSEPERESELGRLLLDAEPAVRAAALVGRLRSGHPTALDQGLLALRDGGELANALEVELIALARDPRTHPLLLSAVNLRTGPERLALALALCLQAPGGPREVLLEALEEGSAGSLAAAAVEALRRGATPAELASLSALFPSLEDRELDAALVRTLLGHQDPSMDPFLRAVLWTEPWHRASLAAHFLAQRSGVHALHEELQAAPAGVSTRALRRIGFTLGEIGGPQQVEILARRRGPADPALQAAYLGAMAARTY